MQNGAKIPQNRPSPVQNRSESKFSWIIQQSMNRDKYAEFFFTGKYLWEKVPAFLKSHKCRGEKQEK